MSGLLLSLLLLAQGGGKIERDVYGVPAISAHSQDVAFFLAGKACAQDRLWQMELSRRIARGRMAEIFGASKVASDSEILRTGYTDEELQKQLHGCSKELRQAYQSYASGVNEAIQEATYSKNLPSGYAKYRFSPEPWSPIDSVAIAVRLGHKFGNGGAGELRNLLAYLYFKTQPIKNRALDAFDDFVWQNDGASLPTVDPKDDPLANSHPRFPMPAREQTRAQLTLIPPTNILELLPAMNLTLNEASSRVALASNVFYKTGSYAIVVSGARSKSGKPILLSGPQMGHSTPSVVHEMSISTPSLKVCGMDVPGIPGVLIGFTPNYAWAITSGVGDMQDVFFNRKSADGYLMGGRSVTPKRVERTIKVAGENGVKVQRTTTRFGPVILENKEALYSLRSAFWMKEMSGFDALFRLYGAKDSREIQKGLSKIPLSFNFFYATKNNDIGYHYCGFIPIRSETVDPRFPTPGEKAYDWKGFLPASKMPHVVNPSSGLLFNWNNKPAFWWPNFDTPVWGSLWRNELILNSLPKGQIGVDDVRKTIWEIARRDEATLLRFLPMFRSALRGQYLNEKEQKGAQLLNDFDGWMVDGSPGAALYEACVDALREELFMPMIGNFYQPKVFKTAVQPSLILKALEKETKIDYVIGKTRDQVLMNSFKKAVSKTPDAGWGYQSGSIEVPGEANIPYINRGTFIQIVELGDDVGGWSVNSPGVSESGIHSRDQVPLAREWEFKSMANWRK